MSMKSKVLDASTALVQKKDPINHIHSNVCGVKLVNGEPQRQVPSIVVSGIPYQPPNR